PREGVENKVAQPQPGKRPCPRGAGVGLEGSALQCYVDHGLPPHRLHSAPPICSERPSEATSRPPHKSLSGRRWKKEGRRGRRPSETRVRGQCAAANIGLPEASLISLVQVFLTLSTTFFGIGM